MDEAQVWSHRPWVRTAESILAHIAALVIGFVMMILASDLA